MYIIFIFALNKSEDRVGAGVALFFRPESNPRQNDSAPQHYKKLHIQDIEEFAFLLSLAFPSTANFVRFFHGNF
jgi:hypothetical protein